MTNVGYCIRVESVDNLRYLFKRPPQEKLMRDPDLGRSYDVVFDEKSDADELRVRLFTEDEARSICEIARPFVEELNQMCFFDVDESGTNPLQLVAVDHSDPFAPFEEEVAQLRVLPPVEFIRDAGLEGVSFAYASDRTDGLRPDPEHFFFRREPGALPELCCQGPMRLRA